jgi:restriction system protein
MLPVLQASSKGEVKIGELVEQLADEFKLTEAERRQLLPSGRQTTFANRTHWAKTFLSKAGLIESTRRGFFQITDRGKKVLGENPSRIDIRFLSQFDEFKEFRRADRDENETVQVDNLVSAVQSTTQTPDELINSLYQEIQKGLRKELLSRILGSSPHFFEKAIVSLLMGMGYGGSRDDAGRAIGKSGDGGLDGVIDQDTLGLDRVYLQAKRYKPENPVGEPDVRAFAGSLQPVKANKGVFVTTSYFTEPARKFAEKVQGRIVLIDGDELAGLMIKYNVGARTETTLQLKKVDEDFFIED